MDTLRKITRIFNKKERVKIGILFIFIFIGALLETLGISLILPFVSIVTNPKQIQENSMLKWLYTFMHMGSTRAFLIFIGIALLGVYILKNTYLFFMYNIQYKVIYNFQVKYSRKLLYTYLKKQYTYHLQKNTAELLRNINTEVTNMFNQVIVSTITLISEVLIILSLGALLIIIQPIATIIAFTILGFSTILFFIVFKKSMQRRGKKHQLFLGMMIKWVNQSLGAIKEVKVSNKEAFFVNAYTNNNKEFVKALRFYQTLKQVPRLFVESVAVLSMLITVIVIISVSNNTSAITSILALYAMAAFRILPSINRISGELNNVIYYRPSVDVVYNDLVVEETVTERVEDIKERGENEFGEKLKNSIEISNVSYKYPNTENYILKNVSLSIPIGKSIAFIGPSGSGKTTMVDVILGLLEADEGAIYADGINVCEHLHSWSEKLGYIPQFIYLSDDSIRRNVAFGIEDEEIDDEKVWEAIEKAQLKDFINTLPDKLDNLVGERGVRLSGGQRQRIGIARALYNNPEILVFDEATSSLDDTTEKDVMKAIESLYGQKTIIIIAHRLSTIEKCDMKFQVKNGQVINVDNKKT